MIALVAVAAAVGAQTFVTQGVVADQNRQANDFGVRLLDVELSVPPVSPIDRHEPTLPHSAAEPTSSAVTFLAPLTEPQPLLDPVPSRASTWLDTLAAELGNLESELDRSQDRRILNRDSAGSLIEISENDVLIPVRLGY